MDPIENPIESSQKWINQYGYEGNFARPDPGSIQTQALTGLGIGMGAGALADKNPWSSGWRTGLGALLGNIAARTLTTDKNMQDSNATLGAILGGGAGLASGLLKKNKKTERTISLPELQLSAKTASIQDTLNIIRGQLPNIRVPDTLVGGGLGALGGLAYNNLTATPSSDNQQNKRKWRNMIAGAGLGAGVANLAGDRTRRYVSNTIIPFGYGNSDQTKNMSPTLKKVWDAAILDKPQQEGVSDYLAGKKYQAPFSLSDSIDTPMNTAARRELMRIGMGVDTHNTNSMWQKQDDGTYSINPKNTNASNLIHEFIYPSEALDINGNAIPGPNSIDPDLHTDPVASISTQNANPNTANGLMTPISGGQRIPMYPYQGQFGQDYLAKFLKRWNFQPRDYEMDRVKSYLRQRYINRDAKATMSYLNKYDEAGQASPNQQIGNLSKRWALENLLMKDSPWVSQRMYFKQIPSAPQDTRPYYASIPSTANGEVYPGKSIGYFNPKIKSIDETGNPLEGPGVEQGDTDFTSYQGLQDMLPKKQ